MKDWKLEKGILSSKGEEIRNCKITVRINDAVYRLPKKEEVIMNIMLVCTVPCVLQLQRGDIVSGYKAPVWIK